MSKRKQRKNPQQTILKGEGAAASGKLPAKRDWWVNRMLAKLLGSHIIAQMGKLNNNLLQLAALFEWLLNIVKWSCKLILLYRAKEIAEPLLTLLLKWFSGE
ncbi:hypothetical protein [Pontibacter cellulosilyticus]|uniref:Uncharacterized protein n=1 Tax=Pontibacter cellulosilyticus TaxID=1720253 RepID=A0A923N575_9BACT|nr:hypothetical protein [Pontibacter cellulosilyticus]MBC5992433.1 hypothetical protein [Pontibacter cellulosilyticus]